MAMRTISAPYPYLALDLGVPLYATPFTAGLIREKLVEEGLEDRIELNVVAEETPFSLGEFSFRYVPLAHSIPEGNALVIETPFGRIFHTGDWKLDEQPLIGVPATADELTEIGNAGVLALVCDSTNVFNESASGSEASVKAGLLDAVGSAHGRVLITTFASNAARLQTLGEVARETGRRLCVAGRSLDRIIKIAKSCGYLAEFPELIDMDDVMDLPARDVMVVATGGQGEPRAALARIAFDAHPIQLGAGDVVIFSSRQIPGNEMAIGRIQNALAAKNVRMVTERQGHVHVSGHPGRPELKAMYGWIRPDILVPVHGELRHMAEQARFGHANGIRRTIVQSNGDVIRLAPDGPEKLAEVQAGRLVLDGDVILPADGRHHERPPQAHAARSYQRRLRDLRQGPDDRQRRHPDEGRAGRGGSRDVPRGCARGTARRAAQAGPQAGYRGNPGSGAARRAARCHRMDGQEADRRRDDRAAMSAQP